ncbi:MAG: hypothetical protein LH606_06740 [Cytophagaceae bacterium]|nr:hypothetical protein [Cytophagaceae bacterium]
MKDNLTTNVPNEAESPAFLVGAVISRFFIGQKIASVYKENTGFTVVDIDKKRGRILMRQNNMEKPEWFDLSEFQNGL